MSRYLILVLLNAPFVFASILAATVSYKLGQLNGRRFLVRVALWSGIFLGLIFAQNIYLFLFSRNLTQTEPLSLFDVIQITGVIGTFFIAHKAYLRADRVERRLQDLHQELSIRLSSEES